MVYCSIYIKLTHKVYIIQIHSQEAKKFRINDNLFPYNWIIDNLLKCARRKKDISNLIAINLSIRNRAGKCTMVRCTCLLPLPPSSHPFIHLPPPPIRVPFISLSNLYPTVPSRFHPLSRAGALFSYERAAGARTRSRYQITRIVNYKGFSRT